MNRHHGVSSPTSDWLLGAVKRNPEGLLLLAAGCALMMRSGRSSDRTEGWRNPSTSRADERPYGYPHAQARPSVADGMLQVAERAGEYASDIRERVGTAASAYAGSVSQYADDARRSASEYTDEARRTVTEQTERLARQAQTSLQGTVDHVLRTQPLAVALAGFAAGAAIAAAFPATDFEQQALGGTGENLTEAVGQAGQQLRKAGAQAGERLMSAADERGLNSEGLKDMAREAAGAFGSAFSGEQSGQPSASSGSSSMSAGGQEGRSSQPFDNKTTTLR